MNIFDLVLINPIYNILIAFYQALNFIHLPGSLGFAIILMTVLVRLIVWPLTSAQLKSAKKMADLKPHMDKLKQEHGHDKVRHQQELSKLYKEHGVNPLTGCLPLVVQIPIFIALYNVLSQIVQFDKVDFVDTINVHLLPAIHITKIPDPYFLGINLAFKPDSWQQHGILLLSIPIITGALQFIQSKMMAPPKSNLPKKAGQKDDAMASVQSQMTYLMPVMIAFFSYGFPVGLSLYWNTFTIIGIIQQYSIAGAGPFNKYLPKRLQK